MEKSNIIILASSFRRAVKEAKDDGCFNNDIPMKRFPKGCCGGSHRRVFTK